ncbi:EpsG family protein [Priestia megaterium]|uniref:EpsG family protein n=1 Tax=Priestia megaterium TaxID=1404 RepID=UPI001C8E731F|nr:EpsG family protein [Priestia megaterium]MBY0196838.1 EpsG family protein [Priestia megaterium]
MLVYFLLPLTVVYFLFLSRATILKSGDYRKKEIFIEKNNFMFGFWFLVLLSLAVCKGINVGTDYRMYYNFFLHQSYDGVELGISTIYDISVKYHNFFLFALCIYFIFLFFIFWGIKKNSPNYLISILVFILTHVYFTGYNQLRQIIAVAIIFAFVSYLVSDKKFDKFKYIIVILVALLFHNSAIFLFCLFLIPKKRFAGKVVIPLFILTIILYFVPEFKNKIGEIIVKFSGFYMEKYETNLDYFFEVNKEKGLLQLVPVVIQMIIVTISLYFPKIKTSLTFNSNLYKFSSNVIIINLILYSLAGIEAIDRLQVYFSCFNIYFYSFLIHLLLNSKDKKNSKVFIVFIAAFWVLYYTLRLITNVHGIVPYSLLNNQLI